MRSRACVALGQCLLQQGGPAGLQHYVVDKVTNLIRVTILEVVKSMCCKAFRDLRLKLSSDISIMKKVLVRPAHGA